MRVNIAQASAPSLSPPPSPHNTSSSSSLFPSNKLRLPRSASSILTCSTLSRSKSTDYYNLRRSCSASFDGHDFPHYHPIEDCTRKQTDSNINTTNYGRSSSTTSSRSTTTTMMSFPHSDCCVDVLEPSLLGIRPEPPDWPARDAMIRDCIALRASSIELPLSLRMIKMKQKFLRLEEERETGDLEKYMKDDPINSLCCSTLYIIKEVQSQALRTRGLVLDEEVDDGIVSKVQREMTSSFIWLFREVFAKTPDLMLQVMVITSNFATKSLETLQPSPKTQENLKKNDDDLDQNSTNWGVGNFELGVSTREVLEKLDESEVGLWNLMVEDANQMEQGGYVKNEGLRFVVNDDYVKNDDDYDVKLREKKIEFVSPVGVMIEGDDYEEYYRTDLLYQIGLFQEPNNTLLLSNYAQFLCLVFRDYDRYNFFAIYYYHLCLLICFRTFHFCNWKCLSLIY